MIKYWMTGFVLAGLATPAFAKDKDEPTVLEPSTPWNMHYAPDSCRLVRTFGTGEAAVTLIVDQFAPGDAFRMTLAGEPMKRYATDGEAEIRFGSALPEQSLFFYLGTIGEDLDAWIFPADIRIRPLPKEDMVALREGRSAEIAPITDAEKASVTAIDIGRPLRHPLRLYTGSMKAGFAALDTCTDELLTHWGIDVARYHQQSRPATPVVSPGKWLKSDDYPVAMLRKGQPGIVEFRLTVGADGNPTACHIQQSTNPEGFDRTVCGKLMKRARFEPALDKDGKPFVSFFRETVHFAIPH
jgi:TonB family protein